MIFSHFALLYRSNHSLLAREQTDGTKSGPITIKGKSGTKASDVVLRGDGRWVMFQIMHDYYVIKVRNPAQADRTK